MSGKALPPDEYVAERATAGSLPPVIDRDKGIVAGVRVANPEGRSDCRYPAAVLAAAASLYNGAPVNVGHHLDERTGRPLVVPPAARFGRLDNVRPAGDGGLVGDLRFNAKHPFADQFLWACEHAPDQYGFSQFTRCRWNPAAFERGERVADAILQVMSVDIVSDGGLTASVFHSAPPDPAPTPPESKPMDPKQIAAALTDPAKAEAFISALMQAVEAAGDPAVKAAFLEAVMKATMSQPADPAAAVGESLSILRRLPGPVGKWAANIVDGVFVAESQAKARAWADDLIAAEGLAPALKSDTFVELVAESMADPDRAKRIIADRKGLSAGAGKPRTSPKGDGKPKTLDEIADDIAAGK